MAENNSRLWLFAAEYEQCARECLQKMQGDEAGEDKIVPILYIFNTGIANLAKAVAQELDELRASRTDDRNSQQTSSNLPPGHD